MGILEALSNFRGPKTYLFALGFAALCIYIHRIKDPKKYIGYLEKNAKARKEKVKTPTICVVGAGFTGLAVCGALKRWGIDFQCFEADQSIGGNWYHGVYETVHIISSKVTTEYKDFPMPEDFPEFPSKDQVLSYLQSFVDHYQFRDKISLNAPVKFITPLENEEYEVLFEDGSKKIFGGVIICNGHHWDKRFGGPYPNQEGFTGEVLHSKDYKRPQSLEGKRVLVLGGGNSACDIAVEAGRFAETSHISQRRGYWLMPRSIAGYPLIEWMHPLFPVFLQRLVFPIMLRFLIGTYESYGLQHPDHKIWDHHPTINSELLQYLKLGRIHPHPDIKQFCGGKTVEFVDGKKEDFDLIIHATGYHVSVPLLAPEILDWEKNPKDGYSYPNLVDGVVHPTKKNLFIFGLGQPRYGAGPLLTAGSELIALFIKEQTKLQGPVGAILQKLGGSRLDSYLFDPIEKYNRILLAFDLIWLFPHLERFLFRKGA